MSILMYTTASCPYCIRAKRLLATLGVQDIREIRVDEHPDALADMLEKTGGRTVPQIRIGETWIGGCDELHALHRAGRLEQVLRTATPSAPLPVD
jgi:glutaredoxin 3